MQSQSKLAPIVDKRGIKRSGGRQEQDVATVEMDVTLARMFGMSEGQKVCTHTTKGSGYVSSSSMG